MKNFWYKDYFIMLDKQHNGSIRVVASNDYDDMRTVYYDYTIKDIINKTKSHIRYRMVGV